ncbi:MAG: UDP-N-acetylmuramoyl-L-alanyl-D-glutamate--2,6-diaminopimelate ligase, partial [Terriglobia bacterium]
VADRRYSGGCILSPGMILEGLLRHTEVLQLQGSSNAEIRSLAYDSRQAGAGCLFFAIEGERADGHRFVGQALERGAAGVVSEREAPPGFGAVWVRVGKVRRALAEISRAFYGGPDSQLTLVGITGTNGKTTTAYLVQSVLEAAGMSTGLVGTIEYRLAGRSAPAHHTTPESLDVAAGLAEHLQAGGSAAVMEVSSHALAQERTWGFRFAAAVFTNLTGDHLDYHRDMETYFAAKRRLFEGLGAPPPELGVINRDDAWGKRLLEVPQPRQITYGVESNAQVKPKHFTLSREGIRATINTLHGKLDVESALLGRPNLQNILAAAAVTEGLGVDRDSIQQGIANLRQVPGRFERICEGQPFIVLVDYAHTHDALRNALATARELTRNRVVVVFGCGGDRDRTKRPLMGEVAGSMSDSVVLTSDNPRSEDPILVMNDVLVGLQKTARQYVAEVDREKAIRQALEQAREGDVVLIAGKGHETYQVLKEATIAFDDREAARRILREMGFGGQPARE